MQAALKNTILRVAGVGHSRGGQILANLVTLTHARNTWRNQAVGWKKWLAFCTADQVHPLAANEQAVLRYVGWLYAEGRISGTSLRGYLSAVFTAYRKLGVTLSYTSRWPFAAYQTADGHRQEIPASILKRICDAALTALSGQLRFIRAAAAICVSFMFFERGEAGASLSPQHIRVTPQAVHLAIPLRKNGPILTPHTLTYRQADSAAPSPIDLLTRYDIIRRSSDSRSNFYWSLPSLTERYRNTSATITSFLDECLQHLSLVPPPGVSAGAVTPSGLGLHPKPRPSTSPSTEFASGATGRRLPAPSS